MYRLSVVGMSMGGMGDGLWIMTTGVENGQERVAVWCERSASEVGTAGDNFRRSWSLSEKFFLKAGYVEMAWKLSVAQVSGRLCSYRAG